MTKTLTEAIKEDHQEMYEYFDKYKNAIAVRDLDTAERWCRQMMWEIARHAVAEEIIVYPLMSTHLPSNSIGTKLADKDRADHQEVKEQLVKLDALLSSSSSYADGKSGIGSPEFERLMHETMNHLKEHNDNEERDDLPMLEPKLGEEGSKKAAWQFSLTKKFVPTRAHPSAPNQPPLETLAGFLLAPIDKIKDLFAKFPTDEMKEE